jgi:hypothetical protein
MVLEPSAKSKRGCQTASLEQKIKNPFILNIFPEFAYQVKDLFH